MNLRLGHLPFILSVAAVVLAHQAGESLLFGFAVVTAFTNLFSAQVTCALGKCHSPDDPQPWNDPARLTNLANQISGITGIMLFVYFIAN